MPRDTRNDKVLRLDCCRFSATVWAILQVWKASFQYQTTQGRSSGQYNGWLSDWHCVQDFNADRPILSLLFTYL